MMIMKIHASGWLLQRRRYIFFIFGEFQNNTCSDKLKGRKKKKKVESSVSIDEVWGGGGGARCGGGCGYVAIGC